MPRCYLLPVLLFLLPGLGCRPAHKGARVLDWAMERSEEWEAYGVSLTFDRPMVPAAKVGQELDQKILRIEPGIEGRLQWASPQRLLFQARRRLARSTEYRVELADDLRAVDGTAIGGQLKWSFVNDRLTLMDQSGDTRWLPPMPRRQLRFSQPVKAVDVAEHCVFRGPGRWLRWFRSRVPIRVLKPRDPQATVQNVALEPAQPLDLKTEYRLECSAELHGTEGPVGMEKPFVEELHTYGDFKVVKLSPATGVVAADEATIRIELSNPVSLNEFRTHLRADPPIAGLQDGAMRRSTEYEVRVNLEPQTKYTLTLSRSAKDQFGQTLVAEQQTTFLAGKAKPRLSLQRGTFVVDASAARLPFATRNLDEIDVSVMHIPDEQVIPLFEQFVHRGLGLGNTAKELGIIFGERKIPLRSVRDRWLEDVLDLPGLSGRRRGVLGLLVSADAPIGKYREAVANLTDLGLVAKLGASSGLLWVVSLSSGRPLGGVHLEVRNQENRLCFAGASAADGTLETPGLEALCVARSARKNSKSVGAGSENIEADPAESATDESDATDAVEDVAKHSEAAIRAQSVKDALLGVSAPDANGPGRLYILARHGEDRAVLPADWHTELSPWRFESLSSIDPMRRLRGFVHTDRGLYRPGETVHIKGLVREISARQGLRVPDGMKVSLVVQDPREQTVFAGDVALSRFGGVTQDLALDEDAPLGDWTVAVKLAGEHFGQLVSETFTVDAYSSTAFVARMKPAKPSYVLGERVRIDLDASYLRGNRLAAGRARFTVRRRDQLPRFSAFDGFIFSDLNALSDQGQFWARREERSYTYEVTSGEVPLDSSGHATFSFSTADPEEVIRTAQTFLIEARVTDSARQIGLAQVAVPAHRSAVFLGLSALQRMPAAGKPFALQLLALDENGIPRAMQATLVLSLREWRCSFVQAAPYTDDAPGHRCEPKEIELERRIVDLSNRGPILQSVTVNHVGTLLVSLRAPDGYGHEVVASDELTLVGPGHASWRRDQEPRVPLLLSRSSHRPGETAELLLKAPFRSTATLLTVERDGILHQVVQPLAGNGATLPLALTERFAPNVFASVVAVAGRTGPGPTEGPQLAMGMTPLPVNATAKRLRVVVEADRASYQPGETVNARISVRDTQDRPVLAEVSFAVADEGTLQVVGYKTPDPATQFAAPFGLEVFTATNWNRIARRTNPNQRVEGEGGDSGLSLGRVRSKLPASAFWAPALQTNRQGTCAVSFRAPDSLTAFRMIAVAADAGDRFGAGEGQLTVRKPLSLSAAAPRFFYAGDRAQIELLVHNQTAQGGNAVVKMQSAAEQGLEAVGSVRKQITVQAGSEQLVRFEVRARKPGSGTLTFSASLHGESDALKIRVPIRRAQESATSLIGEGTVSSAEAQVPISLPKDALRDTMRLEVTLAMNGLAYADEAVRWLFELPYRDLQHLTARLIAATQLRRFGWFEAHNQVGEMSQRALVASLISRIFAHEYGAGSFATWPGGDGDRFWSALALYGLHKADAAGHSVSAKRLSEGVRTLGYSFRAPDNQPQSLARQAFELFVFASLGKPDAAQMDTFLNQKLVLPLPARFLLSIAFHKVGRAADAQTLLGNPVAHARALSGAPGARLLVEPNARTDWELASDICTTALGILALSEIEPGAPLIPSLVQGLLASRTDGHWATMQETLWALLALDQYSRQLNDTQSEAAQAVLTVPGVAPIRTVLGGTESTVRQFLIPIAQAGPLTFGLEGAPFSYSVRLRYGRMLQQARTASRSLTIERHFVHPSSGEPLQTVKLGDLVRVALRIQSSSSCPRLMIQDFWPAGLEPVSPRLPPTLEAEEPEDSQKPKLRWNAVEVHADRLLLFLECPPLGQDVTYSYLAYAVASGTFFTPPATAEEFYLPEQRAITSSQTLEIVPR